MNKLLLSTAVVVSTLSMSAPALASSQAPITSHKVGICHATGSATNPYVFIVVDEHAVAAHTKHQDGRDIINVSDASKCPKAVVAVSQPVGGGSLPTVVAPTMLPETGASSLIILAISMAGGLLVGYRKRLFA